MTRKVYILNVLIRSSNTQRGILKELNWRIIYVNWKEYILTKSS